ncbi:signal peptide protein [Rhodopirellula sallentina SM41]|uniref:Signal peptide protein n=2 Tax=Rhodopirellula TaxID=265488 RepID=M5U6N1_9BACT|nr:signal peptide protein [Rhodopirellula sallentina SM41]
MVLMAMAINTGDAFAQPAAKPPLELTEQPTTDSQVEVLRGDLLTAITHGASPEATTGLLNRQRRIDGLLESQLASNRQELAEIERDGFDPKVTPRREELRKQQSLLWLARVELASLATEMFAERSPDGVALAEQSISRMQEALASFPNDGVVRAELLRLLAEAQLRAGDSDAAIRTTLHATRATAENASGDIGSAESSDELVIRTPAELAFVIRVDLSKKDWNAAQEKLNQFYGRSPSMATRSLAMDLARLQFLLMKPTADDKTRAIGNWLDVLEKREGATARRAAETMVARYREYVHASGGDTDVGQNTGDEGSPSKQQDPRVLRADARYYLRVEKTLPAAVTFARAAIQDTNADRSIDSAIRSAAILDDTGKRLASVELLRQIANRHTHHAMAPAIMLQAASLASQVDNPDASRGLDAESILNDLISKWPGSASAASARSTLIEFANERQDYTEAAARATQMPVEHWNIDTAKRCRRQWQRAVLAHDARPPSCPWYDDTCHQKRNQAIQSTLARMRQEFAGVAACPLAVQTHHACAVLLDSLTHDSAGREVVSGVLEKISDPFVRSLAELRLAGPVGSTTSQRGPAGLLGKWRASPLRLDEFSRPAIVWRLHRDLLAGAVPRQPTAKFLLEFTDDETNRDAFGINDNVQASHRISWLIAGQQTQRALAELKRQLGDAVQPAELLADAATMCAGSSRKQDLKQAAAIWDELASGLPPGGYPHHRAKVESVICQARAGELQDARNAAEWILLSNPPKDEVLLTRLRQATE